MVTKDKTIVHCGGIEITNYHLNCVKGIHPASVRNVKITYFAVRHAEVWIATLYSDIN